MDVDFGEGLSHDAVTPAPVCGSVKRELSRPFRPPGGGARWPRASAFGLSPGLDSPGPLGRQPVLLGALSIPGPGRNTSGK
jgi:hypothetical protein